jgi:hypothetical protein
VCITVTWLHRLGRRVGERLRCWEELAKLGVAIHSVNEGGLQQELVFNVLAAVAQEETRQLSERVSEPGGIPKAWAGTKPDEQRGDISGERRPRRNGLAGAPKVVLDEDTICAPYVRKCFAQLAAGGTARSFGPFVAGLPADARGGGNMNWRAVSKMLRAPVYVGRLKHGEDDILARPQGRWPALVDEPTWLAAQNRLVSHQHVPHQASGRYVLTGMTRCSLVVTE